MKSISKLLGDFRAMPLPWRLDALDRLVRNDDAAGLDKFLQKFPDAVHWEKERMPRDGSDTMPRHSFLQEAVFQEKPLALESLLKHGASPSALDIDGYTPLQSALGVGWPQSSHNSPQHREMAKLLLAYGAPIEQRGKDGKTALHRACEAHSVDAASFLLAQGAQLENVISKDGGGPLEVCLHAPYPCATPAQQEMLRWLLKNTNADPDQPNKLGITPLFYAHSGALAKLLVAAGADIGHKDSFGETPVTTVLGWVAEPDSRRAYMAGAVETRRRYEEAKLISACYRNVKPSPSRPIRLKNPAAPTTS